MDKSTHNRSDESRELERLCDEAMRLATVRLWVEYASRVTGVAVHKMTPEVLVSVSELTRSLVCHQQRVMIFFYDGIPILACSETPTVTVEKVDGEPATVSSSYLILHDEGMKRHIYNAFMDEGAALLGQSRRRL